MKTIRNIWLRMSIGKKMQVVIGILFLVIVMAAGMNIYVMNYSIYGYGQILSQSTLCEKAQEAIENEETAFRAYVREPSESNLKELESAEVHAKNCVNQLPFDFTVIGEERYAKTWNVINGYSNYSERRDAFLSNYRSTSGSVDELYAIYSMQTYLKSYVRSLSMLTINAGNASYQLKYPLLHSMPYLLAIFSVVMIIISSSAAGLFTSSVLTPVKSLADSVRHVDQGDFDVPDVETENRDELGVLVKEYNHMKHVMEQNLQTLRENQELSEQLHKEEIDRMETEKRLETTRLDLLQSQINPHFLFNTLNTISGMAVLEDAETTDRMICSLSSIFRYNLHTAAQFISLKQELSVIGDYLYLQEMRFGDRLTHEIITGDVDTDAIMVPVFLLQPLVENAVVHGVTKKEQGGKISVQIRMQDGNVVITVQDTGVGMDPEQYRQLMQELLSGSGHDRVGIGLGNVYKRIHSIYKKGDMQVETQEGEGTRITLFLPQDEKIIKQ